MSSTRNSQNLLTNVFRPAYTYDGSSFQVALVASNITTVDATKLRSGIVEIGDAGANVFLGSNAGVPYNPALNVSNNVGLGVSAGAGVSNVQDSVFIGRNAGALLCNATDTAVIGTNDVVVGTANTVIGNRNRVFGDNNLVIGRDLCENSSYRLNIGGLIKGDISRNGNLEFTTNVVILGTLQCTAFDASGLATTNVVVPGYIRNSANPSGWIMDISSGNFDFTGTGVSRVSDVSFYRGRINASAGIVGTGFDLSSGLTLTGAISNGGNTTSSNFTTPTASSNSVGGVILSNNILQATRIQDKFGGAFFDVQSNGDIIYAGRISNADSTQSNRIGGVTLSNGTIVTSNSTTNQVGNVTLTSGYVLARATGTSKTNPAYSFSGATTTGIYRLGNAMSFTVEGNDYLTISGGFVGISTTVPTSALTVTGDISYTSRITGSTDATSNRIGGVDLSGGNISNSGSHFASNFFGTSTASNQIGGVTLSNTNITYAGAISNTVINQSNTIGGVTLSNGYMRAGVGTVDAPGISFLTDTSMGLYRVGTQALGFSVGGVARMTICGDRVGIGTTNPVYALDVSSSSGINASFRSSAQAALTIVGNGRPDSSGLVIYQSGSEQGIQANDSNPMYLWTSNTRRLAISSIGNIGIGTINLSNYKLSIRSSGTSNGIIAFHHPTNDIPFMGVGYDASVDAFVVRRNNGTSDLTTGTPLTILRSNGNVGIGTNTPAGPLHVFNGGILSGEIGNVTANSDISMIVEASSNAGMYLVKGVNNTVAGLSFKTVNSSTLVERFRIAGDGNVGIGSTSPGSLLQISSNIGNVYANNPLVSNTVTIFGPARTAPSLAGTTDLNGTLYVNSTNSYARNIGGSIALGGRGANVGGGEQHQTWARISGLQRNDSDSFGGAFVVETNDGNGKLLERMRIQHDGKVGIGTTAPATGVEIGTGSLRLNNTNGYGSLQITTTNENNIFFADSNAGGAYTGYLVGQSTSFATGTSFAIGRVSAGTVVNPAPFVVTSAGNVGVGTSAPAYKLDISGTMSASSNEYTVYITGAGTYTCNVPTGFTKAHITLVGGGGGGGGGGYTVNPAGGAGGGGAGYRLEQIISNPSSFTISIGAGGNGGTSPTTVGNSGGNGFTGSASTVTYTGLESGTMRANGGNGGSGSTTGNTGGAGGAGYYGGGGGGSYGQTVGSGGTGSILSGSAGTSGSGGVGGNGGSGGGASNGGTGHPTNAQCGGGGGGGPAGGLGGAGAISGSTPAGSNGGLGCGGGGGGSGSTAGTAIGGRGGDGYCIIKFLK